MRRRVRMIVLTVVGVVAFTVTFLYGSMATSFRHWPWTKTSTHETGNVFGIEIGSSKADCFADIAALQRAGGLGAVDLADEPPKAKGMFRTDQLTEKDLEVVSRSNQWIVNLIGKNAWLVLTFSGDRLVRIDEKYYRGPTE